MPYKHLALATILCISAACNLNLNDYDPLPKKIYIDKRFSPEERGLIITAMSETNKVLLRPCLGFDGLIASGTLHDDNGFDADGSDFEDDVHGIYKIDWNSGAHHMLNSLSGVIAEAYSTMEDMAIVINLDEVAILRDEIAKIKEDPKYENYEDLVKTMIELRQDKIKKLILYFYTVVQHEFGHMIGLSHNWNLDSMMYPYPERAEEFTDVDKELFSKIRECEYE